MKNFAFIFARGGSKGIKRKNIKALCGRPLLAYAVALARTMDEIDQVFVSTDDAEIASIAKQEGAQVIMRPAELASDTASEWQAWQHAIGYVHQNIGAFDRFVSLPCTSPLRSEDDVRNCLDACDDETDIVITMVKTQRSPWFNMVKADDNGTLSLLVDNHEGITRRQDCPEGFDMTTVAYVAHPEFILVSGGIWDGTVKGVIVPEERSIDIDTEFDFFVAESVMAKMIMSGKNDD